MMFSVLFIGSYNYWLLLTFISFSLLFRSMKLILLPFLLERDEIFGATQLIVIALELEPSLLLMCLDFKL